MTMHLRHDARLSTPNTFRVLARMPDGTRHIEALVRYGHARPQFLEFNVCAYGRDIPERRTALAMTRLGEDCWQVEGVRLHPCVPHDSFVLVQVPDGAL